ncbi:MAG: hypothetical protein IK117_11115 [Bacteroidales bacterium]|nr:hypothetical protein [Bacteroidales bacterium]
MAVLNSTVLERAWLSGSNDFQQRIPNPSITAYANVIENLFAPMNNDLFNEFCGLLNGLNATYVDIKRFDNPLRSLKKPAQSWGNSERHVAVKYLKAHAGRFDDETLLKVERPEFVEWFYSVGEPRRYEFSWSRQEIARAFAADGYGYEDLLSATITQMLSTANYDEMQIMIQMFAEADNRWNGLYRYNLSAAPTSEATGKELLTGIRAVAGRMAFPTTLYNHIDVPVFESPETLILWITPEVRANLDVQTLSAVFQLDFANIQYRIITIPEFPIPDVYAALTSEDFIYYRDFMTGLEPPFYNPGNRTMKYYYWANALIGVNPAANCVLFTTDDATVIPTITMTPSGIEFDPDSGNIEIGGTLDTHIYLRGSLSADIGSTGTIGLEPDAALYELSAVDSDSNPVQLKSTTYVDAYGILHCQKTGIEAGTVITITATSEWVNPSGETTTYTDTFTATVV